MNETKATRYQRLRRRARVAEAVSAGVALGVMAFTPGSSWLAGVAHAAVLGIAPSLEPIAALAVFVTAIVVIAEAAAIPASLYLSLYVDSRYRRNAVQSPEHALVAHWQAFAVLLPSALIAGAIVLASTSLAGRWWWLAAGPLMGVALVGALHAVPALLARFADVRPLQRAGLAGRLAGLARHTGVSLAGVAEWHVDAAGDATALVSGAGRGRRVLLASELVQEWTDDEIAVVVAHELGHIARGDLWRTLAVDVFVLWVALFAADIATGVAGRVAGELPGLPLMAFIALAVWTAATPLRHAQSRAQERRADQFALEATGRIDAFGATLRRLETKHLAEDRPSTLTRWLYHRHPSVAERLAAAESFRGRATGPSAPA